jgi:hypothetical protein
LMAALLSAAKQHLAKPSIDYLITRNSFPSNYKKSPDESRGFF